MQKYIEKHHITYHVPDCCILRVYRRYGINRGMRLRMRMRMRLRKLAFVYWSGFFQHLRVPGKFRSLYTDNQPSDEVHKHSLAY
jgi:hypothetical protein